ncbi:MAG: TRAP transporter large permease [Acuticoccus sp.]
MEPAILFICVFTLLLLGVPVAVSLGLSSLIIIVFFSNDSVSSVAQQLFTASQNYTLLAIPYFILAAAFMSTGGVAQRIIRFAIATVGSFRGGLAMASVLACMLFAALSGSSPSTVVAIGTIAIAGMRQVGYSKEFASGIVANAGTLGILIPPSIVMVVYSAATDVSVGRMFLAGVIPGIVAGLMLMLTIYVIARIKNLPKGEWLGWQEFIRAGKDSAWGLFLIIIILGGIYGGVFTPTEAAAVAAVYSFLIALFIYRDMGPLKGRTFLREGDSVRTRNGFFGWVYALALFVLTLIIAYFVAEDAAFGMRALVAAVIAAGCGIAYVTGKADTGLGALASGLGVLLRNVMETLAAVPATIVHRDTRKVMIEASRTTIMLMFIIVNALLFAHVLTSERIPQAITDWMLGAGFDWFTFLIAVNVLLLIGGQFMEPSGLLLIVAPVVFPIAIQLGVDPVHLGIIMVVNMEIGMITPPIGLNLFVTSGITGMSLVQVVRAALPFVAVLFVFLILITYVPIISTFLPTAMMGPEIVTR